MQTAAYVEISAPHSKSGALKCPGLKGTNESMRFGTQPKTAFESLQSLKWTHHHGQLSLASVEMHLRGGRRQPQFQELHSSSKKVLI